MINEIKKAEAIALTQKINPAIFSKEAAFKGIDPKEFIQSLRELIVEPASIKQAAHPICGISTALKVAAELDPVTLVKMAVNLFINGSYNPGSFLLRQIKVPPRVTGNENYHGLSSASYVLQISIKNFLNRFSTYNPEPTQKLNQLQGITYPWQIRKFLSDYFKIDAISKSIYKNDFEYIKSKINDEHRIIALTSWKQMLNPTARLNLLSLHYVVIKGIEKKGEEIILYTDNPSSNSNELQKFIFSNETELRKAVRAVYCYNHRGFKETELLEKQH